MDELPTNTLPFSKPLESDPDSPFKKFIGDNNYIIRTYPTFRTVEGSIQTYRQAENARKLFAEHYDISLPKASMTIGKSKSDQKHSSIFTLVERVHGISMGDVHSGKTQIENAPQLTDDILDKILKYLLDIYKNGGPVVLDLRVDQFMYGNTDPKGDPKLYLVDLDPFSAVYHTDGSGTITTSDFVNIEMMNLARNAFKSITQFGFDKLPNTKSTFNSFLQNIQEDPKVTRANSELIADYLQLKV